MDKTEAAREVLARLYRKQGWKRPPAFVSHDTAIAAMLEFASPPSPSEGENVREACAKIAQNYSEWQGSSNLADERTKENIAAAIRSDPSGTDYTDFLEGMGIPYRLVDAVKPSLFGKQADWWNGLSDTERKVITRPGNLSFALEASFNAGWHAAIRAMPLATAPQIQAEGAISGTNYSGAIPIKACGPLPDKAPVVADAAGEKRES